MVKMAWKMSFLRLRFAKKTSTILCGGKGVSRPNYSKKGGPKMDAGPYPSCNLMKPTGMVSVYGTLPA